MLQVLWWVLPKTPSLGALTVLGLLQKWGVVSPSLCLTSSPRSQSSSANIQTSPSGPIKSWNTPRLPQAWATWRNLGVSGDLCIPMPSPRSTHPVHWASLEQISYHPPHLLLLFFTLFYHQKYPKFFQWQRKDSQILMCLRERNRVLSTSAATEDPLVSLSERREVSPHQGRTLHRGCAEFKEILVELAETFTASCLTSRPVGKIVPPKMSIFLCNLKIFNCPLGR